MHFHLICIRFENKNFKTTDSVSKLNWTYTEFHIKLYNDYEEGPVHPTSVCWIKMQKSDNSYTITYNTVGWGFWIIIIWSMMAQVPAYVCWSPLRPTCRTDLQTRDLVRMVSHGPQAKSTCNFNIKSMGSDSFTKDQIYSTHYKYYSYCNLQSNF